MKIRKCPKCRSIPDSYIEVWNGHTIEFDASEGVPDEEGYLNPGNPDHVKAVCSFCGYIWRLKGVCQITDLSSDNKEN